MATGGREADVTYFYICREEVINGKRVFNHDATPRYSTLEKAMKACEEIRRQHPDAQVYRRIVCFRDVTEEERKKLIGSLE